MQQAQAQAQFQQHQQTDDDRTNRFVSDPPSSNHRERAASQPPRTSEQPFLSSPIIPSSRSPWSSQNRLLSPGGIPVPMASRSASFSHQPSSASTSSSYFASAMRDRSFSSTFEDDESEELGDDASAMVGRLNSNYNYDDYGDEFEPASYHGQGQSFGRGGGRLPPSLSSSISPSMLSTPANPLTRGRTYAPDLSRSRSQSLATATVARPLPIGSSYGGLGSAINSWSGDESGLSGGLGGYMKAPGRQQDQSNMSPFVRDVGQILLDDQSNLRELLTREDVLGSKYGHIGGGSGGHYAGIYGQSGYGGSGLGRAASGYTGLGGGTGRGFLPDGGGSGTTSRRHSVSVVTQPKPTRGSGSFAGAGIGFGAGSAVDDEYDDPRAVPIGGSIRRPSVLGGSSGGGGGGSGLMLSDEDLMGAGDLPPSLNFGMANLGLRDQLPQGSPRTGVAVAPGGGGGGLTSQPSSLPIYAPLSRSPLGPIGSTLGLSIPGDREAVGREDTVSRASRGSASEHSTHSSQHGSATGTGSGHGSSPRLGVAGLPGQAQQQHQQAAPGSQQVPAPNVNTNGTSYAARARAGSNAGSGVGVGIPSSPLSPMSPTRGMLGFGMGSGLGVGGLISPTTPQHPHAHAQQQQHQFQGGYQHQTPTQVQSHHQHQQFQHQHQAPTQHHPGAQHGFYAPQQQPQHVIGRRPSNASVGDADGGHGQGQVGEQALGRGLPLSAVPPSWQLYIVEFKAGRTDLFYLTDVARNEIAQSHGQQNVNGHGAKPLKVNDYVIVEADRGKDLGRVVNDSISVEEVERWLEGRAAANAGASNPNTGGDSGAWGDVPLSPTSSHHHPGGGHSKKEINPKRIYAKAGPNEAALLSAKMADEAKALQLCQSKVRAKKLPMEVVDAEYQWDRRKLTFYFVAEKRIDFRELVRELFRLYKTRIWMASLQGGGGFEQ